VGAAPVSAHQGMHFTAANWAGDLEVRHKAKGAFPRNNRLTRSVVEVCVPAALVEAVGGGGGVGTFRGDIRLPVVDMIETKGASEGFAIRAFDKGQACVTIGVRGCSSSAIDSAIREAG